MINKAHAIPHLKVSQNVAQQQSLLPNLKDYCHEFQEMHQGIILVTHRCQGCKTSSNKYCEV